MKLWVNGQLLIDKWVNQGATDWIGAINLQAGVLYDIRMEYYQATGNGEAQSLLVQRESGEADHSHGASLPSLGVTAAPPSITSALTAIGFVNQPFTFAVTASNSAMTATTFALGANSGRLPPGLSLNENTASLAARRRWQAIIRSRWSPPTR